MRLELVDHAACGAGDGRTAVALVVGFGIALGAVLWLFYDFSLSTHAVFTTSDPASTGPELTDAERELVTSGAARPPS